MQAMAHGETLYLEMVEYSQSKREKADELKELRKKKSAMMRDLLQKLEGLK